MGLIDDLEGKQVYLDTNILIYLIEGNETYQALMSELATGLSNSSFQAVTSYITLTEMLPPLVKRGDEKIICATIDLLRDSGLITLAKAGADVCIQAGFLRGKLGMKTPDALHVATSVYTGCDIFLTNDAGIRVPGPLKRLFLSEYV